MKNMTSTYGSIGDSDAGLQTVLIDMTGDTKSVVSVDTLSMAVGEPMPSEAPPLITSDSNDASAPFSSLDQLLTSHLKPATLVENAVVTMDCDDLEEKGATQTDKTVQENFKNVDIFSTKGLDFFARGVEFGGERPEAFQRVSLCLTEAEGKTAGRCSQKYMNGIVTGTLVALVRASNVSDNKANDNSCEKKPSTKHAIVCRDDSTCVVVSELSVSSCEVLATKCNEEHISDVQKCLVKLHRKVNEANVTGVALLDELESTMLFTQTGVDRGDEKNRDKALRSCSSTGNDDSMCASHNSNAKIMSSNGEKVFEVDGTRYRIRNSALVRGKALDIGHCVTVQGTDFMVAALYEYDTNDQGKSFIVIISDEYCKLNKLPLANFAKGISPRPHFTHAKTRIIKSLINKFDMKSHVDNVKHLEEFRAPVDSENAHDATMLVTDTDGEANDENSDITESDSIQPRQGTNIHTRMTSRQRASRSTSRTSAFDGAEGSIPRPQQSAKNDTRSTVGICKEIGKLSTRLKAVQCKLTPKAFRESVGKVCTKLIQETRYTDTVSTLVEIVDACRKAGTPTPTIPNCKKRKRTARDSRQKLSPLVVSVKSLFTQWLQPFADEMKTLQTRLNLLEAGEREYKRHRLNAKSTANTQHGVNVVKLIDEVKHIKEQLKEFTTVNLLNEKLKQERLQTSVELINFANQALRDQNQFMMANNRNNSSSSNGNREAEAIAANLAALAAIPGVSANFSVGGGKKHSK